MPNLTVVVGVVFGLLSVFVLNAGVVVVLSGWWQSPNDTRRRIGNAMLDTQSDGFFAFLGVVVTWPWRVVKAVRHG